MGVRVVVADDFPLVREGVVRALNQDPGIVVVAQAENGQEALDVAEELRPDVTLVDIDLAGESGFAVAEQLHQVPSAPSSPVILIYTHDEVDFADMIAASPAHGFVHKSALTAQAICALVDS